MGWSAWTISGIRKCIFRIQKKVQHKFKINTACWSYRFFQACITFILVDFAWLFFRSEDITQAFEIIRKIIFDFRLGDTISYQAYLLDMEEARFFLLIFEVAILLFIDILHEKNFHIISWFNQQNLIFRWLTYFIAVTVLLIGTIYNYGTNASTFIYAQF